MSIPKCEKIFFILPLDNVSECVILYALTPKKLSRFCLQRKRSPFSIFEAVAFSVVPKNHLIIFLFSRLSIGLFQKLFFIFPLDKVLKFLYNVCGLFLPGLFLSLSYRWSIKADLLLKVDLFLFQNLSIIARSVSLSIPKT